MEGPAEGRRLAALSVVRVRSVCAPRRASGAEHPRRLDDRAPERPVPVPEDELENVRLFAKALRGGESELERRPFMEEGQWVEVLDGPFRGVRGVVVQRRGRRRVLIGVKAIGQGLEVNVDTGALRPIPSP
jgi:transcription antitermination factor NusG